MDREQPADSTGERIRLGFEKIDRDLHYLMGTFADVLEGVGGTVRLPKPCLGMANRFRRKRRCPITPPRRPIPFPSNSSTWWRKTSPTRCAASASAKNGMLTEPGLWGFYLRRLKEAGWTAEQLAAALPHVRVEPVLTAHPTESKRVTVLEQHRGLYLSLVQRGEHHVDALGAA